MSKKSTWKYFIQYLWLPFATFMTAVDLIQIGDNLWPTLIKWADFFGFWIGFIRDIRNIVFTPFDWINISVPVWLKDYLLFGSFLTSSLFSSSYRLDKDGEIFESVGSLVFWFLIMVVVYPISLFGLLSRALDKNNDSLSMPLLILFLKVVSRVILVSIAIVFINYILTQAFGK